MQSCYEACNLRLSYSNHPNSHNLVNFFNSIPGQIFSCNIGSPPLARESITQKTTVVVAIFYDSKMLCHIAIRNKPTPKKLTQKRCFARLCICILHILSLLYIHTKSNTSYITAKIILQIFEEKDILKSKNDGDKL